MASGVNKCFFVGNLGRDPEVRYSKSGTAVCNFSIACNERRKVGDEWEDHTEWIRIVCFGKTAENVGQYLAKGRSVHVEARCQTRKWEDKDGNEKWTTEFVAKEILFLGGGSDSGGKSKPQKKKPAAKTSDEDLFDDSLPF